jgi:hypothetical protein
MPGMTPLSAGEQAELEAVRQQMIGHLRLINDVLARTPMAGRYWIFGGALLGYVREGNLLLHVRVDADFAFLDEDLGRLEACIPSLVEAGFLPLYRFPGIEGDAFEWSFRRGNAKVEFFRHDVVGDSFRYHACGQRDWGEPRGHVYNIYEIPAQPLAEFRFLGRTWLMPRDPERQLTTMYGDWRTPNAGWDYMRGPNIVETHPWDASTYELLR